MSLGVSFGQVGKGNPCHSPHEVRPNVPSGTPTTKVAIVSDLLPRDCSFRDESPASVYPNQIIPSQEIQSIFEDKRNDRVLVNWRVTQPRARTELKAAFLAILCIEQALPRGGDITVTYENGWVLVAEADVIDADHDLWAALSENQSPEMVTPNTVHFALLPETLQSLSFLPTVMISNTRMSFYFD